jgi:hypothetical protein
MHGHDEPSRLSCCQIIDINLGILQPFATDNLLVTSHSTIITRRDKQIT